MKVLGEWKEDGNDIVIELQCRVLNGWETTHRTEVIITCLSQTDKKRPSVQSKRWTMPPAMHWCHQSQMVIWANKQEEETRAAYAWGHAGQQDQQRICEESCLNFQGLGTVSLSTWNCPAIVNQQIASQRWPMLADIVGGFLISWFSIETKFWRTLSQSTNSITFQVSGF